VSVNRRATSESLLGSIEKQTLGRADIPEFRKHDQVSAEGLCLRIATVKTLRHVPVLIVAVWAKKNELKFHSSGSQN
jgi:hypothetical protein